MYGDLGARDLAIRDANSVATVAACHRGGVSPCRRVGDLEHAPSRPDAGPEVTGTFPYY